MTRNLVIYLLDELGTGVIIFEENNHA